MGAFGVGTWARSHPTDPRSCSAARLLALPLLGPSLDLFAEGDVVIGDRGFAPDTATVTTFGAAASRGLAGAGIVPVLKHFPGTGEPWATRTSARRPRLRPAW